MEKPGEILISRIYDSEGNDGKLRILIDRLWPRGISHENAALDQSENFANFGPQKVGRKTLRQALNFANGLGMKVKNGRNFAKNI